MYTFIMFVAHVCVLVFDVSLFCLTSAKRGVRSLFLARAYAPSGELFFFFFFRVVELVV